MPDSPDMVIPTLISIVTYYRTVLPPSSHDDEILHRACSVRLPVAASHLEWIDRDISVVDVVLSPCHHPSDWETSWKRAKRARRTGRITQKFLDKENKVWAPIVEHARLCREWQHKQLNEQAARLRLVREDRANDIKQNLNDLGWTDDSYYSTAFLQLAEVNKAEPLTPAGRSR
ncbi:hypothetical protein OG21DRAFT_1480774 [Imleria badia]|nr:hypothetical protein OG21DRAFT_1480774 [Imleria badia]